jgi:hypothetical protein
VKVDWRKKKSPPVLRWKSKLSYKISMKQAEEGGFIFHRNVCWVSPDYTALYSRT